VSPGPVDTPILSDFLETLGRGPKKMRVLWTARAHRKTLHQSLRSCCQI
jgi:hypothetical protein